VIPAETAAAAGDLYYEERGAHHDSSVVFLHGLGSCAADWRWQVAAFEERYRVITLDLPAHGRSALGARPRRERLRVESMAAAVAQLLARLGDGPVHVVGLSLGGCVALALALGAPTRVRSLTLVNAFARLRPAGWRGVCRMLERLVLLAVAPMPVIAAHVARGLFPGSEQGHLRAAAIASLERNDKRAYFAAVRALTRFDVRRRLAEVRCPTLIVAGEADTTVPRASAELLRRSIPDARLLIVPGSGHGTPYDQSDLFNRLVMDWMASLERAAISPERSSPSGEAGTLLGPA
jgi:3-oxoadipate enol-lactonase